MKEIRKITVGPDTLNGMNYIVGQSVFGGHKITAIIATDSGYDVFIRKGDEVKPWQTITNQNIKVEYNLDY